MRPSTKLISLLLMCASAPAMSADLNSDQRKELMVFGMRAMGLKVGVEAVKNIPSDTDLKEVVSTGLNLNKLLCASITDIRPLKVKSTYEVTCIQYRQGSATKAYIVDSLKGLAFVP